MNPVITFNLKIIYPTYLSCSPSFNGNQLEIYNKALISLHVDKNKI